MKYSTQIIYCHCAYYDIIPVEQKQQALDFLTKNKLAAQTILDLCQITAQHPEQLNHLKTSDQIIIFACHPRAVRALLNFAGLDLAHKTVKIINLRQPLAPQLNNLDPNTLPKTNQPPIDPNSQTRSTWTPWFPTIDRERCTNCKQCLNFCLFGVYSLDKNQNVTVTKPAACKTNCPACARVCPTAAIIFPKHPDSPINGAEPQNNPHTNPVDPTDILQKIRNRDTNLKDSLGIPDDVINSLTPHDLARLNKKHKDNHD